MFKRATYSRAKVPVTPALRKASYAGSAGLAVPKEPVKAKPGKRAPTVEEAAWMDAIVRWGCVACRADGHFFEPCEVHHLLRGGHRMGHLWTIGLCVRHHRGGSKDAPSVHPWRKQFELEYGTQLELLAALQMEFAGSTEGDE